MEEGFADLVADQWHGVFMPAGTPEALAGEFQMALSSALEEAAVRRRMDDEGAAVIGSAPKAFAEYLDKELARWRQIARETGIRISAWCARMGKQRKNLIIFFRTTMPAD